MVYRPQPKAKVVKNFPGTENVLDVFKRKVEENGPDKDLIDSAGEALDEYQAQQRRAHKSNTGSMDGYTGGVLGSKFEF